MTVLEAAVAICGIMQHRYSSTAGRNQDVASTPPTGRPPIFRSEGCTQCFENHQHSTKCRRRCSLEEVRKLRVVVARLLAAHQAGSSPVLLSFAGASHEGPACRSFWSGEYLGQLSSAVPCSRHRKIPPHRAPSSPFWHCQSSQCQARGPAKICQAPPFQVHPARGTRPRAAPGTECALQGIASCEASPLIPTQAVAHRSPGS